MSNQAIIDAPIPVVLPLQFLQRNACIFRSSVPYLGQNGFQILGIPPESETLREAFGMNHNRTQDGITQVRSWGEKVSGEAASLLVNEYWPIVCDPTGKTIADFFDSVFNAYTVIQNIRGDDRGAVKLMEDIKNSMKLFKLGGRMSEAETPRGFFKWCRATKNTFMANLQRMTRISERRDQEALKQSLQQVETTLLRVSQTAQRNILGGAPVMQIAEHCKGLRSAPLAFFYPSSIEKGQIESPTGAKTIVQMKYFRPVRDRFSNATRLRDLHMTGGLLAAYKNVCRKLYACDLTYLISEDPKLNAALAQNLHLTQLSGNAGTQLTHPDTFSRWLLTLEKFPQRSAPQQPMDQLMALLALLGQFFEIIEVGPGEQKRGGEQRGVEREVVIKKEPVQEPVQEPTLRWDRVRHATDKVRDSPIIPIVLAGALLLLLTN